MDLADTIGDLATHAVERTFGKAVSHVTALAVTYTYSADFQEHYEALGVGASVDFDAALSALDIRKTALDAIGLEPAAGDSVTFAVHEIPRTYRVAAVRYPAPGSVLLVLAERS